MALDDGTTAHLPATTESALLTTTGEATAHTATVTAVTLAGTSDDAAGRCGEHHREAFYPAYGPPPSRTAR